MKALLWLLLAVAVAANAVTGFILVGTTQMIVSLVTGVVVIASGVGLFLTREKGEDVRTH